VNIENSLTERDLSCPSIRFSVINSPINGYKDNIENDLVQEQKVVNSDQPNEYNITKKFKNIKAFRTYFKNFIMSDCNRDGKSIPDLLNDFTKRCPGYNQILEYQDRLNEAEKLNSWGWT
jgi:putative DNA primase/helicase